MKIMGLCPQCGAEVVYLRGRGMCWSCQREQRLRSAWEERLLCWFVSALSLAAGVVMVYFLVTVWLGYG